ncbi:MAG: 3-demethylubiquinone-9 3-O-methyltransferase, partial [Pseudomonadota bacterium]
LDTVIAEIARVLKPGGRLAFDTINRNWLASFVVVTMAENIIRLLPKGTHDPAKFILPSELRTLLTQHGLTPGRFAGLGPVGMTLKGDFIFGHLPLQAVIYMGTAERLPASSPAA